MFCIKIIKLKISRYNYVLVRAQGNDKTVTAIEITPDVQTPINCRLRGKLILTHQETEQVSDQVATQVQECQSAAR